MLVVSKRDEYGCVILDVDDMTEEYASKDELLDYLNSGVEIFGVTAFTLQYNLNVTVILRLSDETTTKDYDGYLLRDYCTEYDELYTQILYYNTYRDILESESVFYRIIRVLRDINPCPYDLSRLGTTEVGYEVYSKGKNTLVLSDLSDNQLYSGDMYLCLFVYLEENKAINGVEEITLDYMVLNGDIWTKETVFEHYRMSKARVSYSNNQKEYVTSTWATIDRDFGGSPYIAIDGWYFPAYNLKSCVRHVEQSSLIPFFSNYDVAVSFEAGVIYFQNGASLSGAKNIAYLFNAIDFISEELKNEVLDWLSLYDTKSSVMKRTFALNEYIARSSRIKDGTIVSLRGNCVGEHHFDDFISAFKTDAGCIAVYHPNYVKRDKTWRRFWMTRVPKAGSCWYDFVELKVVVGTMSSATNCLCNEEWLEYYDAALRNGIIYHNERIIPLCITTLRLSDHLVDIRVACAIMPTTSDDSPPTTAIDVVEVPLLFLGGRFEEYTDCYVYKCLFQSIYLEKGVVELLTGQLFADSLINTWADTGTHKAAQTIYDVITKSSVKSLRSV